MTTFSEPTFQANDYNTFRPTYSTEVFDYIVKYHKGPSKLAVDIGCGSGQASYPLATYFEKVIGTDASAVMVRTAKAKLADLDGNGKQLQGKLEFVQSKAESLAFLEDSSVDLVTAAQCIHWFNHPVFFKEVSRVLRPGGTLAFWGYVDPVFGIPEADALSEKFNYTDPEALGPQWEQPGRQLLRELLSKVEPPSAEFKDGKTILNDPSTAATTNPNTPLTIQREVPLEFYLRYVKTSSSYHRWQEVNPGKPDVADAYAAQLSRALGWTPKTVVRLQWKTVLKLARRR